MKTGRIVMFALLAAALGLAIGACRKPGGEIADTTGPTLAEGERLTVYTSCFPVDWLTRQVAGDLADVTNILPVGEDPPEWTPPTEVITAMQGAHLVVVNGATFEGWLSAVTLPDGALVDTSSGLGEQLIQMQASTHSHGRDGAHTHEGTDPHTWSDPKVAAAQAAVIRDALSKADPANAAMYETNYTSLAGKLEGLDMDYKAALAGYADEVMSTSHPAFNYLGRRYGLHLINFGFEPDEEPAAADFQRLRDTIEDEGLTVMLWESHPTEPIAAQFTELGLSIIFLDPLEQPPENGTYDYLAQAQANVTTLKGLFPGDEAEATPAEPTQ